MPVRDGHVRRTASCVLAVSISATTGIAVATTTTNAATTIRGVS